MTTNRWIGQDELVIYYDGGTYHVFENDDDTPVFSGSYEKCLEYIEKAEIAYKEAAIG